MKTFEPTGKPTDKSDCSDMENRIIMTGDGSHSVYNPKLKESYHSFHGAIQESEHVFIDCGLNYLHGKMPAMYVLEIGFGTGLNALLGAVWSHKTKTPMLYDTIEAFPLDTSITDQLNYAELIDYDKVKDWLGHLHYAEWQYTHSIHDHFLFCKMRRDFQRCGLHTELYNIIFFDAFAPNKQPEMWSAEVLEKVVKAMSKGGIFLTYSVQGQLRRNLKMLGLKVDILPGPPGKKEMLRAVK